jgi:hypothetical protein
MKSVRRRAVTLSEGNHFTPRAVVHHTRILASGLPDHEKRPAGAKGSEFSGYFTEVMNPTDTDSRPENTIPSRITFVFTTRDRKAVPVNSSGNFHSPGSGSGKVREIPDETRCGLSGEECPCHDELQGQLLLDQLRGR